FQIDRHFNVFPWCRPARSMQADAVAHFIVISFGRSDIRPRCGQVLDKRFRVAAFARPGTAQKEGEGAAIQNEISPRPKPCSTIDETTACQSRIDTRKGRTLDAHAG